jgi:hypothetical protein
MSLHLSREEMEELTGKRTGPAMARWCVAHQYPYVMGGAEPPFPQVLRDFHLCRLQSPATVKRRGTINWDSMKKAS